MVIKQAARARILTRICEIGAFFVAHLSEGVLGRSGEARGPKFETKTKEKHKKKKNKKKKKRFSKSTKILIYFIP